MSRFCFLTKITILLKNQSPYKLLIKLTCLLCHVADRKINTLTLSHFITSPIRRSTRSFRAVYPKTIIRLGSGSKKSNDKIVTLLLLHEKNNTLKTQSRYKSPIRSTHSLLHVADKKINTHTSAIFYFSTKRTTSTSRHNNVRKKDMKVRSLILLHCAVVLVL